MGLSTQAPAHSVDLSDEVPRAQLVELVAQLRVAQRHLARRTTESILASLDAVVCEWLRPGSPWRRRAEEILPAATGYSAEMIRYALPDQIEPLRTPHLGALLDDEIGVE